ncbi:hypothetical protein, partial [Halomonas sp. G11]|uniref:hypothetical protein n=1 Tax=Halomonas sp. G11 TaxID=1684425 RepID=UPI001F1B7469
MGQRAEQLSGHRDAAAGLGVDRAGVGQAQLQHGGAVQAAYQVAAGVGGPGQVAVQAVDREAVGVAKGERGEVVATGGEGQVTGRSVGVSAFGVGIGQREAEGRAFA